MSSPIGSGGNPVATIGLCCGGAALLAAGTITMLVCGILGLTGHLQMASVGARCMVSLSTIITLVVVSGCIRCICFK